MSEPASESATQRAPRAVRLPGGRPGLVGVSVAVVAMLAGVVLTLARPEQPDAAATTAAGSPAPPSWAIEPAQATAKPAVRPVRVRIPAIGVDREIIDVGADQTGELIPPESAEVVGWFAAGPAPGDVGPALLAAHVDSRTGPGAFGKLAALRPGDKITVERADRSTVDFVVVSTTKIAKTAFPTELVYAPLPVPMLRLITCGGTFDRAANSYRDNLIVEAALP
jgi:sortase (surface protein transpeptidase)